MKKEENNLKIWKQKNLKKIPLYVDIYVHL